MIKNVNSVPFILSCYQGFLPTILPVFILSFFTFFQIVSMIFNAISRLGNEVSTSFCISGHLTL